MLSKSDKVRFCNYLAHVGYTSKHIEVLYTFLLTAPVKSVMLVEGKIDILLEYKRRCVVEFDFAADTFWVGTEHTNPNYKTELKLGTRTSWEVLGNLVDFFLIYKQTGSDYGWQTWLSPHRT